MCDAGQHQAEETERPIRIVRPPLDRAERPHTISQVRPNGTRLGEGSQLTTMRARARFSILAQGEPASPSLWAVTRAVMK